MDKKLYYDSSLLQARTENGKSWAMKAVHPPSSRLGSYNGYPDKSATVSIHPEYRMPFEGLPLAATQGGNSGAVLFLNTPGLINTTMYATDLSGGNPNWTSWFENPDITKNSVVQNVGRQRLVYRSTTFQYDANAINNQGMCFAAQVSPSTYKISASTIVRHWIENKHPKLRSYLKALRTFKGDEFVDACIESCNTKSNMFESDDAGYEVLTKPTSRAPRSININEFIIQVVQLGKPITGPPIIRQVSPKSYKARSTEGAFLVHQCTEDVNKFKSVQAGHYDNGTATDPEMLLFCAFEYTYVSPTGVTSSYIEPFVGVGSTSTDIVFMQDTEWSDWSWSYTLFTGCSAGVNIFADVVSGFEFSPVPGSILNSEARPPALNDPDALNSVSVIMQARQDALPAEYNSLGDVGGADPTMSVLKAANSLAGDVVGNVASAIFPPGNSKAKEHAIAEAKTPAPGPNNDSISTVTNKVANLSLENERASKSNPSPRTYYSSKRPKPRPKQKIVYIYRRSSSRSGGRTRSRSRSVNSRYRSKSANRSQSRRRSTSRGRRSLSRRR